MSISTEAGRSITLAITRAIANELNVKPPQVQAAVTLLDEGATVPFIARYRKEATGTLDDGQLRTLEQRLGYLRELEERRGVILRSVEEQGKLTEELKRDIQTADNKTSLEDLYLPYKPKRRTKAQTAREAGLEPLAQRLLQDLQIDPRQAATDYLNPEKDINDVDAALAGARDIIIEQWAEDAGLLQRLREHLWQKGVMISKVATGKEQQGDKFSDYFEYQETIKTIPSHRALALFRGRSEKVLSLQLDVPELAPGAHHPCVGIIINHFALSKRGLVEDSWLHDTVGLAWRVKLRTRITTDLLLRLREQAEQAAIQVFSRNLSSLLLASPAGHRVTMGLDPGLRTGVKVAVIDDTGKLLDTATIYPHVPQRQWDAALATLASLVKKHGVDLISIGNGTGSRETDQLTADLIKRLPDKPLIKIVVSEAGASVYSASALAAEEFPDLDVSLRGAVSIARRLQDPLAELVKIEPKSIGVGQYQHDVNQSQLGRALDGVVEDCVNAVGVDVNTASSPLLARVSGLSASLARTMVAHRDDHGHFRSRAELRRIPRFGDKTFQQAAGFLRISNGDNALDASAIHPESYPVVERIIDLTGNDITRLIGDTKGLNALDPSQFTDDTFGVATVKDILSELEKPGRDPRPAFKTAAFKEDVQTLNDLATGMKLEGVVTNVTNFGAFVDIGVHQDGLVHISQLSDRFVKDPHDIVKAGDIVKVTVLETDVKRKRIGLSMKSAAEVSKLSSPKSERRPKASPTKATRVKNTVEKPPSAMGLALLKARKDS